MPINSAHPEYNKRIDQWTRCRDVIDGSDSVKGKGVVYLPKLTGQTGSEYDAYKKRALFFSASDRSLSGLSGLITRRTPTINNDPAMDKYFESAKHEQLSFRELFKNLSDELFITGRIFSLIDWPQSGGDPYICTFTAESVINWKLDENDKLAWVVLAELITKPIKDDPFDTENVTQYRLLDVSSGVYTITIYDDELQFISEIQPKVSGIVISEIPGIFSTPMGLSIKTVKPPMLDIVDVNLSQYMTSADLEHGRHYTALPTPVVSGANQGTSLRIGSMTAWIIPEKAKAYYLEFVGEGLVSLERAITEKTGQMAQFSTRLMDTSSKGSEAADTVRLRFSSEAATLSGIAGAIEATMMFLYNKIAEFQGFGPVEIELNKDFLDTRLTHNDLRQLTESLVAGTIDEETFFYNLSRGEIVPEGKTKFNSKVGEHEIRIANATNKSIEEGESEGDSKDSKDSKDSNSN